MDLNPTAKKIVEEARRRAHPWAGEFQEYSSRRDPEAEQGSVCYAISIPNRPRHTLSILQRGNTVEVAYDDGLPPGPAEAQFVFGEGEEVGAIGEAFDFVDAILAGHIDVIREPSAWWIRLLFRGHDSLLRFREHRD